MPKSSPYQSLRLRSLACGAVAIAVAACEHPTAPQARDAIEKVETQVLRGNFDAFNGPLASLITESRSTAHAAGAGQYRNPIQSIPSGRLVVMRDGRDVEYIATILERVYEPAAKSGGRQLIRRTLMAWPADSSNEVLVVASEDSISKVALPSQRRLDRGSHERLFGRLGYVIRSDGQGQVPWFGNRGSVELRGSNEDGPCPSRAIGGYGDMPTDSAVNCSSSSSSVRVSAVLQRGNPEQPDLLAQLRPDLESIEIRSQNVPTVRLTTHCSSPQTMFVVRYCEPIGFWRDAEQFSPHLGLDITRLRADGSTNYVWEEVGEGHGSPQLCCAHYGGPARYRFLTPTGRVIGSGAPAIASNDSILRRLGLDVDMREGGRRLFIMGAGVLEWLRTGHRTEVNDAIVIFELTRVDGARPLLPLIR